MDQFNLLAGKLVVVTGGASGIGRAISVAAARHGAKTVVIADLRSDPVEGGIGAEAEIESLGCAVRFQRTDVSKIADLDRLFELTKELGGVDVMVCNAGIASPNDGPDMSETEYRRLLGVNLDGVYFSAQGAGRQMVSQGKSGSIVMTSSMGGLRGSAFTVVYSTTKGGVCLMAKSLADALGPKGIRVNAVCPGVIDTHLVQSSPAVGAMAQQFVARTPLRRLGKPSEIGDVVAWLGSDLSSFVTGANILVDGGLSSVV
jgi:L-rhamnose 1-dehydrogenase